MAASNTLTYDKVPPTRCGIDDVGGATLENDPKYPPDPKKHPTAEMLNQLQKQAVALGRLAPLAGFSVLFTAGVPSIELSACVKTDPVVFTVTDHGPGDTSITWPTSTFPSPALRPRAWLNVQAAAAAWSVTAYPVTNGVRVVTATAGVAADLAFSVEVF